MCSSTIKHYGAGASSTELNDQTSMRYVTDCFHAFVHYLRTVCAVCVVNSDLGRANKLNFARITVEACFRT